MRSQRRCLYTAPSVTAHEPAWKRWGKRLLMTVGALFLIGSLMGLLTRCAVDGAQPMPSAFILTVQFTGAFDESPERIGFLAPPEEDFYNVLGAIRHGAHDPHAKALVGRIWNGNYSLSQIQDLHDALDEWHKAGKPTYAYSDSFGDGGTGMASYWLALGFDKIWVQPLGMVTVNGFRAELPFGREALRKLGVTPEFFHYTTYKSAMDMFLRSSISNADKEQMGVMVDGLTDSFIARATKARKLNETQVKTIIKGAPYTAEEAQRLGLIDQVGYDDELGARIRLGAMDDTLPFVSLVHYMPHVTEAQAPRAKKEVALINLEGMITDAMVMPEDVQGRGVGGTTMCVSCAITTAAEDKHIDAILLRVNSPGGSPSASETIRHAIIVARAKGKKVVVSMGDAAASGGYWVASAANQIVAQPTTLTGSIGVVGGKFAAHDFFEKYGVHWDEIAGETVAPNLGSLINPYSADAAAREQKLLAAIYDGFKQRVEEGRGIKDVDTIAKGRVWLGKDALPLHLVDALGGFETAKLVAAQTLGLQDAKDIQIVNYMPTPSPLEGIKALLGIPSVMMRIEQEWMALRASIVAPVQTKVDLPRIIQ